MLHCRQVGSSIIVYSFYSRKNYFNVTIVLFDLGVSIRRYTANPNIDKNSNDINPNVGGYIVIFF